MKNKVQRMKKKRETTTSLQDKLVATISELKEHEVIGFDLEAHNYRSVFTRVIITIWTKLRSIYQKTVFRVRIRFILDCRIRPYKKPAKNHRKISNNKIRSDQEQDPFFLKTYPRIRSRTKMKQIRNTGFHIP